MLQGEDGDGLKQRRSEADMETQRVTETQQAMWSFFFLFSSLSIPLFFFLFLGGRGEGRPLSCSSLFPTPLWLSVCLAIWTTRIYLLTYIHTRFINLSRFIISSRSGRQYRQFTFSFFSGVSLILCGFSFHLFLLRDTIVHKATSPALTHGIVLSFPSVRIKYYFFLLFPPCCG